MNVGGRMIMFKMSSEEEEAPEQIDPKELPTFAFRSASTAETMDAVVGDIGLLLLFNILFFAAGFTAFLRYDLR